LVVPAGGDRISLCEEMPPAPTWAGFLATAPSPPLPHAAWAAFLATRTGTALPPPLPPRVAEPEELPATMTWETFLAATTPAAVAAPSRSLILAYVVFVVALILRGWCSRKHRGRRGSPEMVDYQQGLVQDEEDPPPPTLSSNGPLVALPWVAKSRYKEQIKSRTSRAGSSRRARHHLVPPLPNSSKMFSPRKRPRHLKRIRVAQRMVVTRTLTVREAVEMDSETVGWIRQGSVVYVIEACDTEHLFMAGSVTSRRVDSARGPKSSFYSGQGCRGAAASKADSSNADSSTTGTHIQSSSGSRPPPSALWLRLPIRPPSETRRAYVAIASGLPALGWVTAVNAMGVETLQPAEMLYVRPAEMQLQPAACGCSDTKDAACAMCHCASRRNDALGDVSFLPASNDALGDVSFLPASMLRDRLLYLRGVTLSPRVFRGGSSPSSPQPRQPGLAPRERMHELMWGSPAPERPTQLL